MAEDREDIQQEARLIALQKGKLENKEYVGGIARRLSRPGRYKGRLKEQLTFDGEVEIEDPCDMELKLDVGRVLSKLTDEEKMISEFIFIRGWSAEGLSGKMGRGAPYIRNLANKLKAKLREQLKELVE